MSKTEIERFNEKWVPVTESGCWLWEAVCTRKGYGQFWTGRTGKMDRAHRVSYELHKGHVPAGCVVMHKCDVPGCVNPDHLSVGTYADNSRDMSFKGRHWAYRFTDDQIEEMRRLRLAGHHASYAMRIFGVSKRHYYRLTAGFEPKRKATGQPEQDQ